MGLLHANVLFFSFRMPLFFIVSGVFVAGSLAKRGLSSFIITKCRTILYPYFLWGILQITVQIAFSKFTNASRTPADYLYLFYYPRQLEQFWYLYALFNVTVLYVIVKDKFKISPVQNIGIGMILFYLSAIASQEKISLYFIGDIMHYYLFYAIGDSIGRFIKDRNNLTYFQSWKLLLVLLLPFAVTQIYFLYENVQFKNAHPQYNYVEDFEPFRFILIALTGCVFVLCLSFCLQKLDKLKWLNVLGKHSLYIYVSHVMVLASTRVVMTKFLHIYSVPVLLVTGIILGLMIPVLLYKIAVKLNMSWLYSLEPQKTDKKPVLTTA